jgi:hypothetical protein
VHFQSLRYILTEHEAIMKQCIQQFESVHVARIILIKHLKEAISEQVIGTSFIIFWMFYRACLLSTPILQAKLYILFCLFVTENKVWGSPQSVVSRYYSHTLLHVIVLFPYCHELLRFSAISCKFDGRYCLVVKKTCNHI